jgi:hypothetical protein
MLSGSLGRWIKSLRNQFPFESGFVFAIGQLSRVLTSADCDKLDLIIPFQYSPGFILVCESRLYFFSDISHFVSNSDHAATVIDCSEQAFRPKTWGYDHYPQFRAWAHGIRSAKYAKDNVHDTYLLREDGVLLGFTYSVPTDGMPLTCTFREAAHFDCNSSTTLAAVLLTYSLRDPDAFVVSGDMSDGLLFSVSSSLSTCLT